MKHLVPLLAALLMPGMPAAAVEGRFGQGLDATAAALRVAADPAFCQRPLTVECWFRLRSVAGYNILLANQPKSSSAHWELFTTPGEGKLAFYAPGQKPELVPTGIAVVDDRWHHLAAVLEPTRIHLWIDAKPAADVGVALPAQGSTADGSLAFGTLSEGGLGCQGLIDEVHLRRGAHLPTGIPQAAPAADGDTIALWHLDDLRPGAPVADSGPRQRHGALGAAAQGPAATIPAPTATDPELPTRARMELKEAVAQLGLGTLGDIEAIRDGVLIDWAQRHDQPRTYPTGAPHPARNHWDQAYDDHSLLHDADGDLTGTVLRRTGALIDLLATRHRTDLAAQRADLARLSAARNDPAWKDRLHFAACALRRSVVMANPLLDFERLLFVARGTHAGSRLSGWSNSDRTGGHFTTQYFAFTTMPGGGLFAIEGIKGAKPVVRNLLQDRPVANGRLQGRLLENGAAMTPDLSFDGKSILFCWSEATRLDWRWAPDSAWHIMRLDLDGGRLNMLTDGPFNDISPCWLPSGRIAFISERRGGYIRCFRPGTLDVPNYVLHGMKADGSDIIPLSYYETSEWLPSVNNDGMLVYTRWDYTDRENCLGTNFWICNPDGRDPRAPHGNYPYPWHTFPDNTHKGDQRRGRPMVEFSIRAIPESDKYVLTAGPHHGESFGSLCVLDLSQPDDGGMGQLKRLTPYSRFPETETDGRRQYQYGTPWPLSEDFFLCNSWEDLYLVDRFGNQELICERALLPCAIFPQLRLTDPIPLRARTRPPIIPVQTNMGEAARPGKPTARVSVMNVYESDQPLPKDTQIRWLRITQNLLKENPPMGVPAIGYQAENTPRIPLGIVPVEEDGSAYFQAPPGKELIFQILDQDYRAVHSMRSVAFLHPGEHLSCVGCHEPAGAAARPPRGTPMALRREPSLPQPELGAIEPISYMRQVQPIVASSCLPCHRKEGKGPVKMGFDDLRDSTFWFAGGMLYTGPHTAVHGGSRTIPGRFGARYCRLGEAVFRHRQEKVISEEHYRTLTLWLDSNSPRLGAYHDEAAQVAGALVWPRLDVAPDDPLGLEGSPGENTPARMFAAAAALHPAGLAAGPAQPQDGDGRQFPFLVSDHQHDRVAMFRDGRLAWEYRCNHPQDVWRLANGNVLVAWTGAVQEIVPDLAVRSGGTVVWEYRLPGKGEIPTCQPLPDGNVLVGIGGPCRLVEVDRRGTVVKQVQLTSKSGAHTQFRFCRKTAAGTYLVPHLGDNVVREYDGEGKVLWEDAFPAPVTAIRLADGRTLVGGGQEIREYDARHAVTWKATGQELGLRFQILAGIQVLPGGNLAVALWGAKGGTPDAAQAVEITRDKRVAWRVFANPQVGNLAVVQRLDCAGEPLR